MRTQTLTLLVSDLQGYTERQARSSREQIAADVARHEELLVPVFRAFGGEVVKSMGDAFLVAFESPTTAVLAATQVQKRLAAHNEALADPLRSLRVRIGLATGEVSRDQRGDVFGEPVNLASRMQATAEPGSVWLSEATFLAMNRNEVQALEVGTRVFKGIPGEVKVYRILDEFIAGTRLLTHDEITAALRAQRGGGREASRRRVWLLGAFGLLGAVAVAWVATGARQDGRPPLERFESDPTDLASADRWLAGLEDQLYEAERLGTMSQLYREGKVAETLAKHAPRLAGRRSFARVRAVWLMANEPLGPGTPQLVLETVEADRGLRDDARFVQLLAATVEYAKKEPAAHQTYARAAQLLAR